MNDLERIAEITKPERVSYYIDRIADGAITPTEIIEVGLVLAWFHNDCPGGRHDDDEGR